MLGLCCALSYAQEKDTSAADTTKKERKVTVEVTIGGSDNTDSDNDKKDKDRKKDESGKFTAGLTFARIDIGLSKYLDKGSFTLSPANEFLEHESFKTHNVGFEFFQLGYRFSNNFKIYMGAGADWNHIRLKNDITFTPEQSKLTWIKDTVEFNKNRFSSTYLRVPLSFQLRSNSDRKGNQFFFVAGPEVGFLINGKQKQKSEERGKVKVRDDFNFNPFRYGAFVRLGYDNWGVYAKYYLNDVFADNQGPTTDFKNISFGLTFGF
jgi:hypothetical protein